MREHPELSVGSNAEGIEVRSVGNSQTLRETALIEAFNLKADIEYVTKNYAAAKEALADMPPRCSPLPARAERASDACLFVCWTVPSVSDDSSVGSDHCPWQARWGHPQHSVLGAECSGQSAPKGAHYPGYRPCWAG